MVTDDGDGDGDGDGEGKDVADVAIGDAHMLVLTTDGAVYVTGDNGSGQLGLGRGGARSTRDWVRLDLGTVLAAGQTVLGVAAGPRSSFLIVGRLAA